MSKKFRPAALCALAALAFATFGPGAPAAATAAPTLSFSRSAIAGNMARACENAVAMINDVCDVHGPITTTPSGCNPLWGPNGQVIGQVCTCVATTSFCGVFNPNFPTFP